LPVPIMRGEAPEPGREEKKLIPPTIERVASGTNLKMKRTSRQENKANRNRRESEHLIEAYEK